MALERRSLRHHRTDYQSFDVPRLYTWQRVEARLARFPDEIAVGRLAHAELRHAGSDERDLPHGSSPRSRRASAAWPWAWAMSSGVWPSSLRAAAAAPWARSSSASARLPRNAVSCSAVWPPAARALTSAPRASSRLTMRASPRPASAACQAML